jgi:hypothetical protein
MISKQFGFSQTRATKRPIEKALQNLGSKIEQTIVYHPKI